jgi:hypothetical protein
MDKFGEAIKSFAGMSPERMKEAAGRFKNLCTCPACPTYTECAKNAQERLFCAVGKSFVCISQEKDCICPTCPITGELGLKNKLYCMRGSEMAQRYDHALHGIRTS